jgi:thiamine biosynthesis lipoprotein
MKGRWRGALGFAAAVITGLVWTLWPGARERDGFEGEIFGTHYRVSYHSGPPEETVRSAVEEELDRIDWLASTWKQDSELMRYNRAADKASFQCSAELTGLLELAAEIRDWTGGAFDAGFEQGRMDLSGIAKGYAVDQVVELLQRRFGIRDCLVDIGGEIRVAGKAPDGGPWKVGIYAPDVAAGRKPIRLELRDTSVATSGLYFKGPHLVDPRSGKTVDHELISASVIHPSNATADALATALYVMGPEEGLQWARRHGVRARFLLPDGSLREHEPGGE